MSLSPASQETRTASEETSALQQTPVSPTWPSLIVDTATPTSAAPDNRITPPPKCRILPNNGPSYLSGCNSLAAFRWSGCPSGFTSACSFNQNDQQHRDYTMEFVTDLSGRVDQTTAYRTWHTAYGYAVCCPDVLDYTCDAKLACLTTAKAEVVMSYSAETGSPTISTFTPGDPVWGYRVTASMATIRSARASPWPVESDYTPLWGPASTVWCEGAYCADVQYAGTTATPTATRDAIGLGLRPPPGMGRLGPLGIFAVTALFGAVLFAAGLLVPWAWHYRQRRRMQGQAT